MSASFVTLIVPAVHVEAARNLAACIAPGGHGMWTTGLSADGSEPATHYISSGLVQSEFAALLGDPAAAIAAAQAGAEAQGLTLTATLADCQALIAAADISTDPPFQALSRMGLMVLVPPELA